ncbi:MAG: IS66 family transposase [Gammaproteobacteria bacterium]
MNRNDIKKVLDELTGDIDSIADKKAVAIIKVLINLVEMLAEENAQLKEQVQLLKDEINRLKGEQGKPDIRGQSKGGDGSNTGNTNHSSEDDRNKRRKKKKNKGKGSKTIRIDRRVTIDLDKTQLPDDAEYKGYETRIIQDLKIITDNVEFKLQMFYSPSLKKTFIAPLPQEYKGSEFGPGVKALVISLYRDSGMTELAIERFLKTFDLQISHGTISSWLTENNDVFHAEKEDIIDAGRQASVYQQMDDTGSRVNGKNHYTHVLCNEFFTAYFTRPGKDRLTLLEVLCRDRLMFLFNQDALALMKEFGLAKKWLAHIGPILQTQPLTRKEMDRLLQTLFENPKKHSTNRRIVLESAALAWYQQSEYYIQYLMTDDAPQFNKLALHHLLCWIHDGRHYKKLSPLADMNRNILKAFLEQYWNYYDALLAYKEAPSQEIATQLSEQFDQLFSTTTGYDALDHRIAMTQSKRKELLLVLDHPFLPLHNNGSELGTRFQARIRDINFQTVSENGTKSKDTFATLVQTARKMGVNFYRYVYDRVTKKFEMPSLAELILRKAQETQLATHPPTI